MKKSLVTFGIVLAAAVVLLAAGTELSINGTADTSAYCDTGVVNIGYTVLSTGAADSAEVSYTVDGTDYGIYATIASGNVTDGGGWTFDGRNKSATGTISLSGLAPGNHSVEICADQSGNGDQKYDCTTVNFFIAACSESDPCDRNGGVFGQVIGNKNVCKNGTQINFNFKGNFGDPALLTITGPGGATWKTNEPVARSGSSCVYTYNWVPPAGLAAGVYTFTVSGNGNSLVHPQSLDCSRR